MQGNTDKNVYILGAGFSRGLGLPLQDEFLLFAKEVFFRDPTRYKHFENVFKYQDKLSKMRKFLNYPLLNLEHLFNLVEMDIFYSENSEVSEIKKDFVKLINDTLLELSPNPFFHDSSGHLRSNPEYVIYQEFMNMFFKKGEYQHGIVPYNDTIISFNYDLVIETTACIYNWEKSNTISSYNPVNNVNYFMKLNVIFGKTNIEVENLEQIFGTKRKTSHFPTSDIFSNSEPSIKLIKLHGSINWTNDDNKETFIVPPTWNKSDTEIRRLWDIAYKELKEAQRIIIIGYSFPETDIYVKSLLALALNENKILQNIYFINPDKNKGREVCLSLLDKYFEKYCEYKEWTFSDFVRTQDGNAFISEKLKRRIQNL